MSRIDSDDETVFLKKLENIVTGNFQQTPDHCDQEQKELLAPRRSIRKRQRKAPPLQRDDSSEDESHQAVILYKSMPLLDVPEKFSEQHVCTMKII